MAGVPAGIGIAVPFHHNKAKPKKNSQKREASQGKKLACPVSKNLSPKARLWMIVVRKKIMERTKQSMPLP